MKAKLKRICPTILVIEDNASLRKFYGQLLENAQYFVLHAGTYHEGITWLERVIPQVILLDVSLPDGDGNWIIDYIKCRPQYGDTHVIIITGHLHYAATHHLPPDISLLKKPAHPETLLSLVRSLLR